VVQNFGKALNIEFISSFFSKEIRDKSDF